MDISYIGQRVTQLRMAKGKSEYQMSLDLGMSRGYIQGIASGRSTPSVMQLFNIFEYFDVTPAEFFDESNADPEDIKSLVKTAKQLEPNDLKMFTALMERMVSLGSDEEK